MTGGPHEHDARMLQRLVNRETSALWRIPGGGWLPRIDPPPQGLLSGAFNPRHTGHDALRSAAEAWIGGPVYFELPLANADKPALQIDEAADRCRQFHDGPLLVTRAPTFIEKARILPGMTFVVGVDTAVRIVEHRFYGPVNQSPAAEQAMFVCLDELRALKGRFLVAARSLNGQTLRLPDVSIPARIQDLFVELPETSFRVNISSSQLRNDVGSDQT